MKSFSAINDLITMGITFAQPGSYPQTPLCSRSYSSLAAHLQVLKTQG